MGILTKAAVSDPLVNCTEERMITSTGLGSDTLMNAVLTKH